MLDRLTVAERCELRRLVAKAQGSFTGAHLGPVLERHAHKRGVRAPVDASRGGRGKKAAADLLG